MNTDLTSDDLTPEQWLSSTVPLPTAVCARLREHEVEATWCPHHPLVNRPGGELRIFSTFSKLPVIKAILREAVVSRTKWPRPGVRRRPSACRFLLVIQYTARGPAVRLSTSVKLTLEQRTKLEQHARVLGVTWREAVQGLLDRALERLDLGGSQPVLAFEESNQRQKCGSEVINNS
jgi:hypothetical protein